MPRRPLGHLRDLPRGAGGSHRRAATERALGPKKLADLATRAPLESFSPSSIFRPIALWKWLKSYSRGVLKKKAPFPKPTSDSLIRVQNVSRMALAGDWGTGTDEAAMIARLMKQDACDYTIHLGDIYFVGDEASIAENCQGIRQKNGYDPVAWPPGTKGTLAMNGNHEAYAKDGAYFAWILQHLSQPSSCFALINDYWCLVALDTGYNSEGIPWVGWLADHFGWNPLMPSCTLPDDSMQWLETVVEPHLTRERGIVVLSHHQPWSSFDNEYPNAARQLASLASFRDRTVLWLWGHEHRFAAYDLYQANGIQAYGRCLGHGGMPVDRGVPPKRIRPLQLYDDRSYDPIQHKIVCHDTEFGVNGYAILQFSDARLTATYRDISGTDILSEDWTVKQGSVVPVRAPVFASEVQVSDGARLTVPAL